MAKTRPVRCGHHRCRNAARYKIRQANGFVGLRCGRHIRGEQVIAQRSTPYSMGARRP